MLWAKSRFPLKGSKHMRLTLAIVLSFPVLLAGCVGTMTGAQNHLNHISGTLSRATEEYKACRDNAHATFPEERRWADSRFVLSETDPEKLTKMMSKEFLSSGDREKYLRLLAARSKCDFDLLAAERSVWPAGALIREDFLNARDKLRISLLEGKLTFGEYSTHAIELGSLAKKQSAAAWSELTSGLSASHNAEIAQRQAAWAAAAQSMAQSAERNAQALQNMQNSIQQNQPIYTNCYKAGVTINCTTTR